MTDLMSVFGWGSPIGIELHPFFISFTDIFLLPIYFLRVYLKFTSCCSAGS